MTTAGVTVRTADAADRAAILTIVGDAFSSAERDAAEELEIVTATWASRSRLPDLELVADHAGTVVGHVLTALGNLDGRPIPGVAPLAVAPARHGEGIGTALMTEVVARADRAGLPLLVLLGNPRYYGRFGFVPAGSLGIVYRPVGPDNPAFQARPLATYDPAFRGEFAYHWELGAH